MPMLASNKVNLLRYFAYKIQLLLISNEVYSLKLNPARILRPVSGKFKRDLKNMASCREKIENTRGFLLEKFLICVWLNSIQSDVVLL